MDPGDALGQVEFAVLDAVHRGALALTDQREAGEQAASLAASWCRRRLGRAHAQTAWQMLADAAQLGVIRHGRPEARAAGAVIALARVSGLIGPGRPLSAQQVADELGVSLAIGVACEPPAPA